MTSRDFCFWLQGYLEMRQIGKDYGPIPPEQVDCIAKHLALVFTHEIDPSMGGPEHQEKLNKIHQVMSGPPVPKKSPIDPGGLIRC